MRRTARSLAAVALAAVLAVTACSGDDDATAPAEEPAHASDAEPTEDPAEEPAPEPSEAPAAEPAEETAQEAAQEPVEEPAAEPSEEPTEESAAEPSEPAEEPTGESAGESAGEPVGEGDTVFVAGLDEIPAECVDRVAEMLREIEPAVSQVDWDTATLDDLDTMMLDVEEEFEALDDAELESGCARYEFEDEAASFQAMIDLAETEAPGAVGWLTFVQTVFSSMPGGDGAAPAGAPTDCDGAIAYLDELIAGGGTMSSLPVSELAVVSEAFSVLTEACEIDVMNEYMERPEVAEFLS